MGERTLASQVSADFCFQNAENLRLLWMTSVQLELAPVPSKMLENSVF